VVLLDRKRLGCHVYWRRKRLNQSGAGGRVDTLRVDLGSRGYPILIGDGLLHQANLVRQHIAARDVLVVSNTRVAPLYMQDLLRALGGAHTVEAILPDGESHKSLGTLARILDVLVANRFGRDCMIVALGGGVVGDMAGFAAACYQRGVAYVQVPTTLLAQVDSSVGGKTGVNHPAGKNLIGAFHQPAAVLTDTATLKSLPARELRAGLAEVIKYGLICDAAFFDWVEAHIDELLAADAAALAHVIHRSCEIKAEIVGRDEREQGDRALLNLGHTFGHAIESATHYARWLHGEAVGAGLLMAAAMSYECGLLDGGEVERLRRLLTRTGMPVKIEGVAPETALEHMRIDKKVQDGRIRLILMKGVGNAFVTAEYPESALQRTLESYCG
jgi:3-dehydroquinate synthase